MAQAWIGTVPGLQDAIMIAQKVGLIGPV